MAAVHLTDEVNYTHYFGICNPLFHLFFNYFAFSFVFSDLQVKIIIWLFYSLYRRKSIRFRLARIMPKILKSSVSGVCIHGSPPVALAAENSSERLRERLRGCAYTYYIGAHSNPLGSLAITMPSYLLAYLLHLARIMPS